MLGKPLVRFCEGRGGNWTKASPATVWGAPRLLDQTIRILLVSFRVGSWIVSHATLEKGPFAIPGHHPLTNSNLTENNCFVTFGLRFFWVL